MKGILVLFLVLLLLLVLVLVHINPKKRIDKKLMKWVNAMKYGNSKIIQQGTSSLKSQQYFSDYDLFSHVYDKNSTPKNVCTNITNILNNLKSMPDIWFIVLKIQNLTGVAYTEQRSLGDNIEWAIRRVG